MDIEIIETETQCLQLLALLNFTVAIDQYILYLTSFIQELIEQTVLWRKPSNKAAL
jgi:hypothetical protein